MTFDLDVAYPGMGLPAFWKSLFPNWPDELINKFSQGISIDAPKFGFAGGGDISGIQAWWQSVIAPPAQANYTKGLDTNTEQSFSFSLLNPQNSRFTQTARWDPSGLYATEKGGPFEIPNFPPSANLTSYNDGFTIESRRWINVHVYMNYDARLYYPNFQWNWAVGGNLVAVEQRTVGFIMSFVNATFGVYSPYLVIAPNASATPYQFVDTILALHENQADNGGVDYGLLYEYQTFRDAYLKYAQQIDSNTQLVKSQSQAAVNAYRQDYNDRAQREKNDLASKKLQILQAIDNQKQTTLQNYQTQLLTAQNLKLTLNQVLQNG